ncbi:hypothetical protein BDU57DRAFT_549683 [Ampelomyces quisqualis]|uniref:Uncharacterized protein n=1 Tax=Ampelomyces quisqualis TaxID=50730 RepID=A0A6A5QI65_AMPQU|nr:hypothetical protein BDU57DRAFT_549683 [Ampelomyces quisqualis]
MVSKHKKNLRQQAILRAEKYKQEQANEATSSCAARPTEVMSSNTQATLPCTTTTFKSHESPNMQEPPTYGSYSIAGGIAPEAIFLPIESGVVCTTNIAIGQHTSHKKYTGSAEGPSATISTPPQPIEARPPPQDDHTDTPFFRSFTDHDSNFAFAAATPMTLRQEGSPRLAFAVPTVLKSMMPAVHCLQTHSTNSASKVRSIFDVLEERGNQDSNAITTCTSEVDTPKEALHAQLSLSGCAAIGSVTQPGAINLRATTATIEQEDYTNAVSLNAPRGGSCYPSIALSAFDSTIYAPKPHDNITLHGPTKGSWSRIDTWVHLETERLFQADIEHNASSYVEAASGTASQDLALVPYHAIWPVCAEQQPVAPVLSEVAAEPSQNWHSKRIFFADTCGYTRLVDYMQMLYDIDIVMDDGASDFDSIASPMKLGSRVLPVPALSTITSLEESDEGINLEGFTELIGMDCTFHTRELRPGTCDINPVITQGFSEDEDVIDPLLVFGKPKNDTANVSLELSRSIRPAASVTEIRAIDSKHYDAGLYCPPLLERELTAASEPSTTERLSEDALLDTSTLAFVDTAYVLHPLENSTSECTPPEDEAHAAEEVNPGPSAKPFSSDWASELSRKKLGTESLSTFLGCLECSKDGCTTKSAIVAAFLALVNLERERRDQRPLPSSYTASVVMASKILPYTIFLGTTSLGSFLEQFCFGESGGTTLEDVHRFFETASKLDLHLQITTRTGIMGMLGRRLGRLS